MKDDLAFLTQNSQEMIQVGGRAGGNIQSRRSSRFKEVWRTEVLGAPTRTFSGYVLDNSAVFNPG